MSQSTPFDPRAFLASASSKPGVYRMFDADGALLYVGKASNLKKRLSSYFRKTGLSPKTEALVSRIQQIDTTITANETEALLLEQSLIKANRPPYNILLRDDKSYPYVFLSSNDDFPRLGLHRGTKRAKGRYFGPYPSAGAIRESLGLLQKTFLVRQCEDSYYRNRTRPCLQYQIKRCKAPCVGLVDADEYAEDVRHSVMFLEGRSNALNTELTNAMEQASMNLDFERAAELRDQIALLRRVQDQQSMDTEQGNVDIIAASVAPGGACVHVVMVRNGRVLGSKNHFPRVPIEQQPGEVLAAFLPQYYLGTAERELPPELIVNAEHADFAVIAEALAQARGYNLSITSRVRGNRKRWLDLAAGNAEQSLASLLSNRQHVHQRFEALQQALQLDELPTRLECYDISHSSGEATVASCVVFGPEGPLKSDYRRFNIEGVTAGDDYAAMRQALHRRFSRLKDGEGKMPDVLLVDGGKGQMNMAIEVLQELAIHDLTLLGVAKGVTRKAGMETLYLNDPHNELVLPGHSPALHLIQHIRDEAHRFAITGHRQRRGKARTSSSLEGIAGVGPKRRRELLRHFGGLQELKRASTAEIAKAPGISKKLAEQIYAALHSDQNGLLQTMAETMNIPNILTLIRVALIPIFILLFYMPFHWSYLAAAVVFTLASITDWLDGYLARKLQQSTPFGAFLDPVADKLMVVIALVLLVQHHANFWITAPAAIIIGREIVISALREWMAEMGARAHVAVSQLGKYKTALQMVALVVLLANPPEFTLWVMLGYVLLALSAVLTLWSMVVYLIAAWPHLRPDSDQNSAK